jgi:hypothetical protein
VNPQLFAFFVQGARGQVLDNQCGSVVNGVANGTDCIYHSLGWNDDEKREEVMIRLKCAITSPIFMFVFVFVKDSNVHQENSFACHGN